MDKEKQKGLWCGSEMQLLCWFNFWANTGVLRNHVSGGSRFRFGAIKRYKYSEDGLAYSPTTRPL